MAKSKAQLNEILTTTPSIHRTLATSSVLVTTTPVPKSPTTRRVATQTTITLSCDPAEWAVPKRAPRVPAKDEECGDDSNNNRVSSTEKLKLESQIDSERTAVAALTELGILSHQQKGDTQQKLQGSEHNKVVTTSTILKNIHSSESISLIPVNHEVQQQQLLHEKLKDMSQLETAAVLMDISKKVIISPPSSNPHSPPHSNSATFKRTNSSDMMMDLSIKRMKQEPQMDDLQQHQRRESVIRVERGSSEKKVTSSDQDQMMVNREQNDALLNTLKNRHQLNVIKLNDNHSRQQPGLTVLNVDRLNNGVHFATRGEPAMDEDEEDLDDDSSDPGRLQVDMSQENHSEGIHDDDEDLEAHQYRNGKVGYPGQHQHQGQKRRPSKSSKSGGGGGRKNKVMTDDGRVPSPMMMLKDRGGSAAGITAAQLAATAMASMASATPQDAHGLWQLIAQTTLNNNNGLPMGHQSKEAVQLLHQMIQNKNMQLNLAMPQLNLAALGDMQQPLSLMKVRYYIVIPNRNLFNRFFCCFLE